MTTPGDTSVRPTAGLHSLMWGSMSNSCRTTSHSRWAGLRCGGCTSSALPLPRQSSFGSSGGRYSDVAVDLRRGSPTYGRQACAVLSAENRKQLFVPVGFAHGFATLEPETEVAYKVSSPYAPAHEGGLLWNDPELGIDWPFPDSGCHPVGEGRVAPAPLRTRQALSNGTADDLSNRNQSEA